MLSPLHFSSQQRSSKMCKIFIFFLFLSCILFIQAEIDLPSTTIWQTNATTVAGSNSSRLSGPQGIAIDENDTLYIADTRNDRVVGITANTTNISIVLGTGYGSGPTQFNQPTAVFVTRTAIYVADSKNYRVQKYARNGTFLVTAAGITNSSGNRSTLNKFGLPLGLFVDSEDYLYVSDAFVHRVLRFPPNSTSGMNGVVVAGTGTLGIGRDQLNSPRDIYVDSARNLYIADFLNNRIQKWAYEACYGITVAGMGSAGSGLDRLFYPISVSVDTSGYIYIVDAWNNRVVRWAPNQCSGECIAACSNTTRGSTADRLLVPFHLRFGGDGSLYVSDYTYNRIQKFTIIRSAQTVTLSTNTPAMTNLFMTRTLSLVSNISLVLPMSAQWMLNATTIADANSTGIGTIYGIAIDEDDTMYISDTNNHRILILRSDAFNTTIILGSGPGSEMNQFNQPTDIVVTTTAIYVLDTGNYRVQKYARNGTFLVTAAGITNSSGNQSTLNKFGYPLGLFVDNEDYLYVSDAFVHRVLRFPPNSTSGMNGVVVAGTGTLGTSRDQLNSPRGIYVDSARNLHVADTGNHRIQKWAYEACYGITVAGMGSAGSGLDRLNSPTAVSVDTSGYIYIVDASNNRVVRWAPNQCSGECIAACSDTTAGSAPHRFDSPVDLAFDSESSLYVAEVGNKRVQKFLLENFTRNTTPSSNTSDSHVRLSCLSKATVVMDGSLANISTNFIGSSCDECICLLIRLNSSTTVVCREDMGSCSVIYSHPSLLMSYVKIDLKSRVCYHSYN